MKSLILALAWIHLLGQGLVLPARAESNIEKLKPAQKSSLHQGLRGLRSVATTKKIEKTKIAAEYLSDLDEIANALASDGNLEALVVVRKETRAVRAGNPEATFELGSDKLPSRMTESRKTFDSSIDRLMTRAAAAEKRERAKAIGKLRTLQLKWTRQREVDAALAAKAIADSLEQGNDPGEALPLPPPGSPRSHPRTGSSGRMAGDRIVLSLDKETSMAFRWCPPGKFTMGSPEPEVGRVQAQSKDQSIPEDQEEITISKGFWIAETEATQAQWDALMPKNPSPGENLNPTLPVFRVTHSEADEFCRKLKWIVQRSSGLRSGWEADLPTLAQWEYAARAGTTAALSSGKELSSDRHCPQLDELAWYQFHHQTSKARAGEKGPHAVAQLAANPWGLFDMHGNLREWCTGNPKNRNGNDGNQGVVRGGSFNSYAFSCRSAAGQVHSMSERSDEIGVRPVIVQDR